MTENASELTEAERELVACVATGHHPDSCDCNDEYADPEFRYCEDANAQFVAVESIFAARAAALRDEIAREIEARMGRDADYDDGLEDAADIARGGPR